jgi:hypothetical protein
MMGTKIRSFSPLPRDVSLEDLVPGTTSTAAWRRRSPAPTSQPSGWRGRSGPTCAGSSRTRGRCRNGRVSTSRPTMPRKSSKRVGPTSGETPCRQERREGPLRPPLHQGTPLRGGVGPLPARPREPDRQPAAASRERRGGPCRAGAQPPRRGRRRSVAPGAPRARGGGR